MIKHAPAGTRARTLACGSQRQDASLTARRSACSYICVHIVRMCASMCCWSRGRCLA